LKYDRVVSVVTPSNRESLRAPYKDESDCCAWLGLPSDGSIARPFLEPVTIVANNGDSPDSAGAASDNDNDG